MTTNNQQPQQNQPAKALQPIQQVTSLVYALEDNFNELVGQNPNVMVRFKAEALFALQLMQKNEYLMTTAIRNPNSLRNAILNVASIGLSLNPAEKQAYLVPRDGQVILDVSYMGLSDLATQAGSIKWVKANLVYEADTYEFQGMGKEPLHKYARFSKERGPCVGVYCVAMTIGGECLTEEMTIDECHAIRNRTDQWKKYADKGGAGPWKTDEGEMMKKTVIKRASKLWPKAPKDTRLFKAIEVLNEHEGINFEAEDIENERAKNALMLAAREKQQADRDEKETLIKVTIKELATELTTGLTAQDKGKFMREHLGVTSYDHLNRLSNEDLRALAEKLTAMKPNEGEPDASDISNS